MSMNKQKIKNLLSYSNSSFRGAKDESTADRFGRANESDILGTIKTKRTNLDETSKDRSKNYSKNIVRSIERKPSANASQSIDFNYNRKKSLDRSGIDFFAKMSKKNSKEK